MGHDGSYLGFTEMDCPLHEIRFIAIHQTDILGCVDHMHHPFSGDGRFSVGGKESGDNRREMPEQPDHRKQYYFEETQWICHENSNFHVMGEC